MSILPQPDQGTHRAWWKRSLSTLLPGHCLLCGDTSESELLCVPCTQDLPAALSPCCPQCGIETTHGERCGSCLNSPPSFDRTFALFDYDFPADRLIHALKYGHQLAVADWLGQALARRIADKSFDRIIPMPLHPERLRERGFNQAMEIARALGFCLKIPVDRSSLVRRRATAAQATLAHKERQQNVRGAFDCLTDFTGLRLMLVDDVMTTGATAREAARVLAIHGASGIAVTIAARARRHT